MSLTYTKGKTYPVETEHGWIVREKTADGYGPVGGKYNCKHGGHPDQWASLQCFDAFLKEQDAVYEIE